MSPSLSKSTQDNSPTAAKDAPNVKFSSTENENGEIPLKFTYDIMANPNDEDVKSNDFRNYIGDILVECVEEQLKNGKLQIDEW